MSKNKTIPPVKFNKQKREEFIKKSAAREKKWDEDRKKLFRLE